MKFRIQILLIIIIFFPTSKMFSQTMYVKLSPGVIRNFNLPFNNSKSISFYSELNFGGKFVTKGLQWELGIGYWDDGNSDPLSVSKFNYSSFITAFNLKLVPQALDESFYVPLKLICGISYHYIDANIVYFGPTILTYHDYETEIFYYDIGLELYFPVSSNFYIVPRTITFLQIGENSKIVEDFRYSISVGIEYKY